MLREWDGFSVVRPGHADPFHGLLDVTPVALAGDHDWRCPRCGETARPAGSATHAGNRILIAGVDRTQLILGTNRVPAPTILYVGTCANGCTFGRLVTECVGKLVQWECLVDTVESDIDWCTIFRG